MVVIEKSHEFFLPSVFFFVFFFILFDPWELTK